MAGARTAAGTGSCGGSGPTVLTRMTGAIGLSSAPADLDVGAWRAWLGAGTAATAATA